MCKNSPFKWLVKVFDFAEQKCVGGGAVSVGETVIVSKPLMSQCLLN